jgi:hypothetical protein
MKEMLTPPEAWAVVNHPLQPWMLKTHILVAPLQVFSVGLITSRHIWPRLKGGVKRGRASGVTAALAFLAMVISGYTLQVLTGDLLIRIVTWGHLILGVVFSVGLALHWPATRGAKTAA